MEMKLKKEVTFPLQNSVSLHSIKSTYRNYALLASLNGVTKVASNFHCLKLNSPNKKRFTLTVTPYTSLST